MAKYYKENPNAKSNIKKALVKGLDRSSIILQNEIKQNLSGPHSSKKLGVVTGNLRRSIQTDRSDIGNLSIRVGTNSVYSRIHEFGGLHMPARPYMRPAYKAVKGKMKEQFKGLI